MKRDRLLSEASRNEKRRAVKAFFAFIVAVLLIPMQSNSQDVSVRVQKGTLSNAFSSIQQQTSYRFVYSNDDVSGIEVETRNFSNSTIEDVLRGVLTGSGLTWSVSDNVISIRKQQQSQQSGRQVNRQITGRVVDSNGQPLPGVSVLIKGTQRGAATDRDGRFNFQSDRDGEVILAISFMGMKSIETPYRPGQNPTFTLEEDAHSVDDVVVTGMYTRNKESFTGSTSRFSGKELKMAGSMNALQSLKSLDPSFAINENNLFGSDPNRLPDIEIRGKTSVIGLVDEMEQDPNQPLIIIDGFESTLQVLNDLSIDLIESITLLKDAAATAIYGTQAANGIVVVETKRPEPGRIRISYNNTTSLSWADLSKYNMMNAREKLEYEKLSGVYGTYDPELGVITDHYYFPIYQQYLAEVNSGVDSYFMSEPLRFAVSHRHTVSLEGGAEELRYGVNVAYGNTAGVMKYSDRETLSGQIKLIYRKNKISVSNILDIQNVEGNNPTVPFSEFTIVNPMFRKTDENGEILRSWSKSINTYYNPVYDMKLKNINRETTFNFYNKLELEWAITSKLRARGRLGISKTNGQNRIFVSPFHSRFQTAGTLREEMGTFDEKNTNNFNYNGELSLSYSEVFNEKHVINLFGQARISQFKNEYSNYSVVGFTDDEFGNPNYAIGYKKDARPDYKRTIDRAANFLVNGSYSYANRYVGEFTYRQDGSSVFGLSRHFTTTWSAGVAWNIHNEKFFTQTDILNNLKLRGSIGNPGNSSFSNYISINVYEYNVHNWSYFGPSLIISNFGNKDISWQKTLDHNVGLDLTMFSRRLRMTVDYFYKVSDPLVIPISIPPSAGTSTVYTNMGKSRTNGFTFTANYQVIKKEDVVWSVNFMGRKLKEKYAGLGNDLAEFNTNNQGVNMRRYYDGASANSLWAVPSLGIDPGTGREVFLTKAGLETYVHNYDDEVLVGDTTPKLEGTFGTSLYYKGFSLYVAFRYRIGGQAYMQTLYDKVENIQGGTQRNYNRDRRALKDRWQKPGDIAKFRDIANLTFVPMSSRFVMDNNQLIGESISLGYETTAPWLSKIGASSLEVRANMSDIFYLSSIKNERGLNYPFARTISLSAGIRF